MPYVPVFAQCSLLFYLIFFLFAVQNNGYNSDLTIPLPSSGLMDIGSTSIPFSEALNSQGNLEHLSTPDECEYI